MRKKMIIAIIIIIMFATFFIMRGIRAKNIGTISGAEYDYLTIGDYRYERTEDTPVSRADKGKLPGLPLTVIAVFTFTLKGVR